MALNILQKIFNSRDETLKPAVLHEINFNKYFSFIKAQIRNQGVRSRPMQETTKLKHRQVILLVDNRLDKQGFNKSAGVDFRNSAFKQTQIDSLQPKPDFACLNEGQMIIFDLKRKVSQLQKRVIRLESQSGKDANNAQKGQGQAKKKRRKFSQLPRNLKCHHLECQKLYGSETSLKNHLKLKHSLGRATS